MIATIAATVLKWLGGNVLDRVLTHLEKRADSQTERERITSLREQHLASEQASVIRTGMSYRPFWVVWMMFAVPLALWWIAVMADTIANGALPDIGAIPPQLVPWADAIFQNLFYSGAGLGAASIIGNSLARRK